MSDINERNEMPLEPMPEVIIDEEFRVLLTPLDPEAYARLEIDILEHGIIYPLLLWNGVLIDGYNRFSIASKHNIPFQVEHLEFDTREEVKIWIITNQVARRNLSLMQLSYFRGKHYNLEKLLTKNAEGRNQHSEVCSQFDNKPPQGRTASRLATHYGVASITIIRDSQLAQIIDKIGEISPEAKAKILSGEANISRTRLQELSAASEQELIETIEMILDGTHKARISRAQNSTDDGRDFEKEHASATEISNIMGNIATEIVSVQTLASRSDTDKSKDLKPALRGLINMLEELYSRI